MFSTALLPVSRNINSCSSIADHYHGDNMIGPFSHVYVCPMQHVMSLALQTDSIKLEFSFGEEIRYVEYALVYANRLLSQSRGQDHRVTKPALNAQH